MLQATHCFTLLHKTVFCGSRFCHATWIESVDKFCHSIVLSINFSPLLKKFFSSRFHYWISKAIFFISFFRLVVPIFCWLLAIPQATHCLPNRSFAWFIARRFLLLLWLLCRCFSPTAAVRLLSSTTKSVVWSAPISTATVVKTKRIGATNPIIVVVIIIRSGNVLLIVLRKSGSKYGHQITGRVRRNWEAVLAICCAIFPLVHTYAHPCLPRVNERVLKQICACRWQNPLICRPIPNERLLCWLVNTQEFFVCVIIITRYIYLKYKNEFI